MSWTHYRLVFRLESPLHIGYRKTGNLMQTRRYVPGKNLWAALTERIGLLHGAGDNHEVYKAIGDRLQAYFRFGYLWPTYEGRTSGWAPHFPWDDPAHWDYLYLDSQARTALDPFARAAAEGMLYDVEFIAPYTRQGRPVYLVGDLWVRDDAPQNMMSVNWQTALHRLQIGGERTYGWGRLTLVDFEGTDDNRLSWGEGWEWGLDEYGLIRIIAKAEARLPVHALAADAHPYQAVAPLQGPVEPLLGWERQQGRYALSRAAIMYEPGAQVSSGFSTYIHPWGWLYLCPSERAE